MKKTFTLIETIVVLGVVGFFIPLIFNIIFIISREQMKINSLSLVKREGDYVVSVISNLIRNYAYYIHSSDPPTESNIICNIPGSFSSNNKIIFRDKNNNWSKIYINSNKISSYSSILNKTFDLTSSNTMISNFSISCENNALFSSPIVSLSFDICYKGSKDSCILDNVEEFSSLRYKTKVKLRNY